MSAPRLNAHAAVLLAAGVSERLGQPKQLLCRAGETLLHRMARLAASTTPATLVIALPAHAHAMVEALRDFPDVKIIHPEPGKAMGASLQAAAASVKAFPRVLVLGCDQPALKSAHLHALLDGATNSESGCAATVLSGTVGVPAVVPGSWFEELEPTAGNAGFRERLRALPRLHLALIHATGLALDIDTLDDLCTARQLGLIDPP